MEQLLKILEDNARLPIEDIATMLNKSPAEVGKGRCEPCGGRHRAERQPQEEPRL